MGATRPLLVMLGTKVAERSAEPEQGRIGRLDALYEAHAHEALRLAYLLTGDRALAEDLTQDAFVKVLGHFQDLRNRDAFWWYLRKTIVNLSRSHFRRWRVERSYLERYRPAPQGTAGPDLGDRDRLRVALLTLRPEQRAAVVLRYYADLTEPATAEILGCPVGTVKSMVRGMESLREELNPDD
jgi:RNA polymerase sigma-70 factor (sigma-E family)